jgi:hypothetical protein
MHYELATWRVKNLLLVPSFAFPPSAIIGRAVLPRRPKLGLRSTAALPSTARRAGWVGCNLALTRLQGVTARQARVPAEARIPVVTESQIAPRSPSTLPCPSTIFTAHEFKRVKA